MVLNGSWCLATANVGYSWLVIWWNWWLQCLLTTVGCADRKGHKQQLATILVDPCWERGLAPEVMNILIVFKKCEPLKDNKCEPLEGRSFSSWFGRTPLDLTLGLALQGGNSWLCATAVALPVREVFPVTPPARRYAARVTRAAGEPRHQEPIPTIGYRNQ